ncbi:MAG: site-specific integrase [Thiomicrorhabdus sp.]|nr:site-specific integrase [Thiomicrorhabdus sp.]
MNNTLKKPTLLDEMRTRLRREGYAYSTENSYCDWVRRFVKFHAFKSREGMLLDSSQKVEQFLTDLAVVQNVAPSTQNQALNARWYIVIARCLMHLLQMLRRAVLAKSHAFLWC